MSTEALLRNLRGMLLKGQRSDEFRTGDFRRIMYSYTQMMRWVEL